MNKQQEIKQFLEKIKQNKGHVYQGIEAKVFIGDPEDKFVVRYLKKKNWMVKNGEKNTLRVFKKYAESVNELCNQNVQTPRIYTTTLTSKGTVRMVQDKAPGQLMFLDGIDSAAGVFNVDLHGYFTKGKLENAQIPYELKKDLLEKMHKYNIISQQKLLDAPRAQYEQYAHDIARIAMSPSLYVDFFCENFFYDEQKGISFIDLGRSNPKELSEGKQGIVRNVGRAIHILEQAIEPSCSYVAPTVFTKEMKEESQALNVKIVVKIIEAFKKMGALQKLSDKELSALDRYAYVPTHITGLVSGKGGMSL